MKTFFKFENILALLASVAVMLFAYGFYSLLTWSYPMYSANYPLANHSLMSDKAEVFYASAVEAYDKKEFDGASRLLQLAYEDLVSRTEDGSVPASKKRLAGDIMFVLGKSMQARSKKDAAIKAYETSLRLQPDNLACKYNLEMLIGYPPAQPPAGGGGGGGAGGNDPQGGNDQSQTKGKPPTKI